MDWSRIASSFQHDGALRDIYVLGTSVQDWAKVCELLRATPECLTFKIGDQEAPLPTNMIEIFRLSVEEKVLASLRLGKQLLNCHFFTEDEIEFDLDPCDVTGPGEAVRLADFIKVLGRTLQKEVLLTHENDLDDVIARYDPENDALVWQVAG